MVANTMQATEPRRATQAPGEIDPVRRASRHASGL